MDILKACDISVSFKERSIIKKLSLSIDKGKIVTIIGPNGSGKTTLLRVLCRNLKPEAGVVSLNGKDIFNMKTKNVAKELAIMTQNHASTGDITVKQLVEYGRFSHRGFLKGKTAEDESTVEWALNKTGMDKFSERIVDTLSGGERQRAWIAMALAQKPKILLLDEPTTFLDICYQIEVLELIHALNREEGITVLMVLHDINFSSKYSDELVIIKDGGIYKSGSPQEVINETTMKEVFGVVGGLSIDKVTSKPIFLPEGLWKEE